MWHYWVFRDKEMPNRMGVKLLEVSGRMRRCLVTPGLTMPIYEQSREVFYDQIKVFVCHRSSVTPHLQCKERSCHRVELLMSECESLNEKFFSTGFSHIAEHQWELRLHHPCNCLQVAGTTIRSSFESLLTWSTQLSSCCNLYLTIFVTCWPLVFLRMPLELGDGVPETGHNMSRLSSPAPTREKTAFLLMLPRTGFFISAIKEKSWQTFNHTPTISSSRTCDFSTRLKASHPVR